jgi:prepilin-type N-terminal cleavage/methylation domain-containing protein
MAHALHNAPFVVNRPRVSTCFHKRAGRIVLRGGRGGFTLVELMVVIAIVAVLAVVAVVSYRKLVLSSHTAEATEMLQSIRAAQEAYHSETQQYANISNCFTDTGGCLYPNGAPGSFKTAWGAACAGSQCNTTAQGGPANGWLDLPVHVDGPVMYGYWTTAGAAGTAANPASWSINGATTSLPSSVPTDWFEIGAGGDVNGNGVYSHLYTGSWTNDVLIDNEGE